MAGKLLNFNEFTGGIKESLINEGKDETIRLVQLALKEKGEPYSSLLGNSGPNKDGVDGYSGPSTTKAIKKFQEDSGLTPNGSMDKTTLSKLGVKPSSSVENKTSSNKGVPDLKDAHLLFNGNSVAFVEKGKVIKTFPAISGRSQYQWFIEPKIWMKRYNMKPAEWAKTPNEGPTPPGIYLLGPEQVQRGSDYLEGNKTLELLTRQRAEGYPEFTKVYGEMGHEFGQGTPMARYAWGNYRYALKPTKSTDTFGRTSMYLHGGSVPGSIGCIDLSVGINDFGNFFQEWKKRTGYSSIYILVDYKTFNSNLPITHPDQKFKLSGDELTQGKWKQAIDKYSGKTMNTVFNKVKLKSDLGTIAYNDETPEPPQQKIQGPEDSETYSA
jgi:peptidoglycan hydrolase-like protein with peptidoglycan-binding domain